MTTFTLNLFNNNFSNKKEHVRINSKKTKHQGRTNDCETPYRNPYNHWRKTSTCPTDNPCTTNEKIMVDNVALNFDKDTCYNPYIRNILNKDGIRTNKFIFSKKLLNEKRNLTYAQNTESAIRKTTDISNNYITAELANSVVCHNVVKFSNRKFNANGAVSGRNRIARLKYNTELQASYGNAVNGTLISRQGVGHYARPPYRNNKNVDNNPDCSERRTSQRSGIWGLGRLRCGNLTSRGAKNRAAFDFAKKDIQIMTSQNYNNVISTNQSNTNQSNTNQINTNQSSTNQSSTNQSSTNQSSTNQSSTNQSSTNQSSTNQSSTNQSSTNQSSTNQSSTNQSSTNQSSTNQSSTNQSSTNQSSTNQSSTNQSSTNQSSTNQSSTNQSSTNQSSTNQSSTNQSSTNQSSTNQSSTNQSSTNQSSTNQSSTNQSSTNQSSSGSSGNTYGGY